MKDLKDAVKEATGLEISDVNYTVEVLTGFALVSKTRSYVAAKKKSEKKGANTHALVLAAYEEKTPGASEAAAVHAPLALPPSEGEGSLEGDENLLSGAAYGRGCCPLERGIEEQVVAECARAYPEGVACADLARNFNLHVKPFGKRVSEMISYKHWYGLEEREMYIPGGRTKGKFLFLAAATAEAKGLEPKPPLARGGSDAAEELRAKRAEILWKRLCEVGFLSSASAGRWISACENANAGKFIDRKVLNRIVDLLGSDGKLVRRERVRAAAGSHASSGSAKDFEVFMHPTFPPLDPPLRDRVVSAIKREEAALKAAPRARTGSRKRKKNLLLADGVSDPLEEDAPARARHRGGGAYAVRRRVGPAPPFATYRVLSAIEAGFIPAKAVRLRRLHEFLCDAALGGGGTGGISSGTTGTARTPSTSSGAENEWSAGFELDAVVTREMPVELYLNVVGAPDFETLTLETSPPTLRGILRGAIAGKTLGDLTSAERTALCGVGVGDDDAADGDLQLDAGARERAKTQGERLSRLVEHLCEMDLVKRDVEEKVSCDEGSSGMMRQRHALALVGKYDSDALGAQAAVAFAPSAQYSRAKVAEYWDGLERAFKKKSEEEKSEMRDRFPAAKDRDLCSLATWSQVRCVDAVTRVALAEAFDAARWDDEVTSGGGTAAAEDPADEDSFARAAAKRAALAPYTCPAAARCVELEDAFGMERGRVHNMRERERKNLRVYLTAEGVITEQECRDADERAEAERAEAKRAKAAKREGTAEEAEKTAADVAKEGEHASRRYFWDERGDSLLALAVTRRLAIDGVREENSQIPVAVAAARGELPATRKPCIRRWTKTLFTGERKEKLEAVAKRFFDLGARRRKAARRAAVRAATAGEEEAAPEGGGTSANADAWERRGRWCAAAEEALRGEVEKVMKDLPCGNYRRQRRPEVRSSARAPGAGAGDGSDSDGSDSDDDIPLARKFADDVPIAQIFPAGGRSDESSSDAAGFDSEPSESDSESESRRGRAREDPRSAALRNPVAGMDAESKMRFAASAGAFAMILTHKLRSSGDEAAMAEGLRALEAATRRFGREAGEAAVKELIARGVAVQDERGLALDARRFAQLTDDRRTSFGTSGATRDAPDAYATLRSRAKGRRVVFPRAPTAGELHALLLALAEGHVVLDVAREADVETLPQAFTDRRANDDDASEKGASEDAGRLLTRVVVDATDGWASPPPPPPPPRALFLGARPVASAPSPAAAETAELVRSAGAAGLTAGELSAARRNAREAAAAAAAAAADNDAPPPSLCGVSSSNEPDASLAEALNAGAVVEVNAYDETRFLAPEHASAFLARDPARSFPGDDGAARAWSLPDGADDGDVVRGLKRRVLGAVNARPGVAERTLAASLEPALNPASARAFVARMVEDGALEVLRVTSAREAAEAEAPPPPLRSEETRAKLREAENEPPIRHLVANLDPTRWGLNDE